MVTNLGTYMGAVRADDVGSPEEAIDSAAVQISFSGSEVAVDVDVELPSFGEQLNQDSGWKNLTGKNLDTKLTLNRSV